MIQDARDASAEQPVHGELRPFKKVTALLPPALVGREQPPPGVPRPTEGPAGTSPYGATASGQPVPRGPHASNQAAVLLAEAPGGPGDGKHSPRGMRASKQTPASLPATARDSDRIAPCVMPVVGHEAPERLYRGDAVAVAARLAEASIDLIYADPPFFTGKQHGARGDPAAYADQWSGGIDGYLGWLRPVLAAFHRLLRPTGTLYLHLDWHAVHYAKVELDRIFGADHFVNEVVWHHGLGGARARSYFPRKHDTLLVYRRGPTATFNVQRGAVTPAMARKYRHHDERGLYMNGHGRRYYLQGGKAFDSVWEIPAIAATAAERTGYPTQKPERLLERIILAASNPGDTVLDLFCGSGVTPAMAQQLDRRWIAGDVAALAVEMTAARLAGVCGPGGDIPLLLVEQIESEASEFI